MLKSILKHPSALGEKQKELLRNFKEQTKTSGKSFFEQVKESIKR